MIIGQPKQVNYELNPAFLLTSYPFHILCSYTCDCTDPIPRRRSLQLLDTNPTLHFHLLQLHLIELIRQSRISEALLFAQTELASKGEEHPQFLADLERTMALLAFEMPQVGLTPAASSLEAIPATSTSSKKEGKKDASTSASGSAASLPMPEHIASLLDQSQRLKTATELNAAILTSQSHGKESKLPGLLKMLAWGEDLLEEKGAEFPKCKFSSWLA